jgi:hypothetical protein
MSIHPSDNIRKVARRHLIYYLRVFDTDTGELLGNLVDISTRGVMLVSDRAIETDKSFKLRMVLPETIEGSREVVFNAISRWCGNDTNRDFYDTGFELVDPDSEFLEAVDKLVDDCLFKE